MVKLRALYDRYIIYDNGKHGSAATDRKVIAHDVVKVQTARSGKYPPMIISIPRDIASAMKLKKDEKIRIYTDGERIYLDRFEEPKI